MVYTVKKLADLMGVSARTLRYYDSIGLLKPKTINESGYREYGSEELNRLQEILFYRAMNFPLQEIKAIFDNPDHDRVAILESQLVSLLDQEKALNELINSVKESIDDAKGRSQMNDKDKFTALKKTIIKENEAAYGDELRAAYGKDLIEASNDKLLRQSESDLDKASKCEKEIIERLIKAYKDNDQSSETRNRIGQLHKEWLMYYWTRYSKDAHKGLAQLYISDERFTHYYDQHAPGLAVFFSRLLEEFLSE